MIKEINGKDYMITCDLDDLSTSASDGKYKLKYTWCYVDGNYSYSEQEFIPDTSIEVRGGWICYKDLLNACIEVIHKTGRSHSYIESLELRDKYFRVCLGT